MKDVVVPIDCSTDIPGMARDVIARYRRDPVRIHLLNVQRPLPRHISRFFSSADLREYHRDCGLRALHEAVDLLDAAGVPHRDHVLVGKPAEEIVRFTEARPGAELVLDDEPDSAFAVFGLGSIGSQVRRLMTAQLPATPAQDASTAG